MAKNVSSVYVGKMKYIHLCTVCDWPWPSPKKHDTRPCGNCGGDLKRLTGKQQVAFIYNIKFWVERLNLDHTVASYDGKAGMETNEPGGEHGQG